MEDVTIVSLIAQGRVVTTPDLINPLSDYMVVGVYQKGTNKMKGDGASYKNYVISIAELLGGGSAYTASNGVVLIGNDFQLASGANAKAWAPDGNTFGAEKYIGTNDNFALPFRVNNNEVLRITNDPAGSTRFYFNATTNLHASNAGIQYSSDGTSPNRSQIRFNLYGANTGAPGVTGFKSRAVGIGNLGSVLAGDNLFRITSIGVSGNNTGINLASLIDVRVNQVFPGYVSTDFVVALNSNAGVMTERFYVTSEGNVGIGTSTPIAKLQVQNTQDGLGTGIPSLYYNTTVGGILTQYQSVNGFKETFTEGALTGSFTNTGGYSDWSSSNRMTWKTLGNIPKMWMDNADGYIGIGSNYFAATAQLHVRGVDATAFNSSLLVQDLAGTRILQSRNDGLTFFGPRYCALSSSNIVSGGEFNMIAEQLFLLDSTIAEVRIEANNKPLIFNTWHGGAANNEVAFAGRGAAGFESFVRTYDVTTTETGLKTYIGSSAGVGDPNFRHCFVTGNVHIGYDEVVNTNTTKLTIRSRNALQTQNNLLLEDNASTVLLKVRNNGEVNMPSLPTAAAGLVTGDLYVDTAANILANGDLVVGRKV